MIILRFFTNILFYYFLWAGPFAHDDELGLSQMSRGKSQPIILIVNIFFFFFRWVGPSPDELAVAEELDEGLTHNTLK